MPQRRGDRTSIGFMTLWLVFWVAAIFVAIWKLGAAAWHGEPMPALFLAIWILGAGLGLVSGARRLVGLLLGAPPSPKPLRNHRWQDGVEPPPVPLEASDRSAVTPH